MCFTATVCFAWCLAGSIARRDASVSSFSISSQGELNQGIFNEEVLKNSTYNGSTAATGHSEGLLKAMDEGNHSIYNGQPVVVVAVPLLGACAEPLDINNFYTVTWSSAVASGSYGKVHQGVSLDPEGPGTVAVKAINDMNPAHFTWNELEPARYNLAFNVDILEAFYKQSVKKVDLVYPFLAGGNLEQWMLKNPVRDMRIVHDFAAQTAFGLSRLHLKGFIHRDFKPPNVMIDTSNGLSRLVITDYGLTQTGCSPSNPKCGRGGVGSIMWMGREAFAGPNFAMGVGTDWFSWGVMIYNLATKGLPGHLGAWPFGFHTEQTQAAYGPQMKMRVETQPLLLDPLKDDALLQDLMSKLLSRTGIHHLDTSYYNTDVYQHPVLGHSWFHKEAAPKRYAPIRKGPAGSLEDRDKHGKTYGWTKYQFNQQVTYELDDTDSPELNAVRHSQSYIPSQKQAATLIVMGGTHPDRASILRGSYTLFDMPNGERPVYAKPVRSRFGPDKVGTVILKYAEFPQFGKGWYFIAQIAVDNQEILGFNNQHLEPVPPASGWMIPAQSNQVDMSWRIDGAQYYRLANGPFELTVAGGGSSVGMQELIGGQWVIGLYGFNGKPNYKRAQKVNYDGIETVIRLYFAQSRGKQGWWIGTDLGGTRVFAFNPSLESLPPRTGWRVPWDGPIDNTLQITRPKEDYWTNLCLRYHTDASRCQLGVPTSAAVPLCKRKAA